MKIQNQLTNAISPVRNKLGRSPWRRLFFNIPLAIGPASLAMLPTARADCREGCDGTATFLGENALVANTSGIENTAVGNGALESNTTGSENTALGFDSLSSNTGSFNTAAGSLTLVSNASGSYNTAFGDEVLQFNTVGNNNTAVGAAALYANTNGNSNTWSTYHRSRVSLPISLDPSSTYFTLLPNTGV